MEYQSRIEALLHGLGLSFEDFAHRPLQVFREADGLVLAEQSPNGREHLLLPVAAASWHHLSSAAADAGIELYLASAFRSPERQAEIIRARLNSGLSLEQVLVRIAPPGYSEHHTGRAVDIAARGYPALEETFEHTEAFRWLSRHAPSFGFTLSYPRGNAHGYMYEPWHWCYQGDA